MKLTKAQRRMLQSVADDQVARHFDVYGGYWWEEANMRLPRFGTSGNFPPLPIRYLLEFGLVEKEEDERVSSGRHIGWYRITTAGRAALEKP